MRVSLRIVLAAALALPLGAAAQGFPNRTVTLTVGFAPGGGTDTAARIIAKKLSENIGQSVVVENKSGAGGNLAAQHIAASNPDGYTIHLTSTGPMSVAPSLTKDLSYDPKKDIAPITMAVMFPNVIVVHPSLNVKTLAEYVALAKAQPGQLNYASSGIGGAGHIAGELFKQRAGIDLVHVPYKGGGPAMADLISGRVTMYPGVPSTVVPHVEGGRLIALAVTGPERTAMLPNVPTVAESGYPGFDASNWYAFVASSKVPREILDYWNRELVKVLKDPKVASDLARQGLDPHPGTREELARYIDRETEKWGRVIREANITAD